MRRPSSAATIGLWMLAGATFFAAGIWEKPFATWTASDIKALRNESPWAGKMTLTHLRPGGEARPIDDIVVARWESALPMRQATLRESTEPGGTVAPDAEAALAAPWQFYEIALKVEGMSAGIAARAPVPIGKETFLKRDGKPPIAAVQVEAHMLDKNGKVIETPAGGGRGQPPAEAPPQGGAPPAGEAQPPSGGGGGRGGFRGGFGGFGGGGSALIVLAFPKSDPITLADKEVELVTKIGQYNARKKFKLKDMVIKGELAL